MAQLRRRNGVPSQWAGEILGRRRRELRMRRPDDSGLLRRSVPPVWHLLPQLQRRSDYFRIACGPRDDDYRCDEVLMKKSGIDDNAGPAWTASPSTTTPRFAACPTGHAKAPTTNSTRRNGYEIIQKEPRSSSFLRTAQSWTCVDPTGRIDVDCDDGHLVYRSSRNPPAIPLPQNTMRDAIVATITWTSSTGTAIECNSKYRQTANVLQAIGPHAEGADAPHAELPRLRDVQRAPGCDHGFRFNVQSATCPTAASACRRYGLGVGR